MTGAFTSAKTSLTATTQDASPTYFISRCRLKIPQPSPSLSPTSRELGLRCTKVLASQRSLESLFTA